VGLRNLQPNNDPERLFTLIKASIERFEDHALLLSPRLVLGLWHPKFLEPSARLLPHLRKAYIGNSPSMARKYFWDACQGFSMKFSCLVGWEGLSFREDCQKAGKSLLVWTVNDRQEMIEACKWGVDAILTDKTADYLALRQEMKGNLFLSFTFR
jgi:phosphatidylglycerol phospholipase C